MSVEWTWEVKNTNNTQEEDDSGNNKITEEENSEEQPLNSTTSINTTGSKEKKTHRGMTRQPSANVDDLLLPCTKRDYTNGHLPKDVEDNSTSSTTPLLNTKKSLREEQEEVMREWKRRKQQEEEDLAIALKLQKELEESEKKAKADADYEAAVKLQKQLEEEEKKPSTTTTTTTTTSKSAPSSDTVFVDAYNNTHSLKLLDNGKKEGEAEEKEDDFWKKKKEQEEMDRKLALALYNEEKSATSTASPSKTSNTTTTTTSTSSASPSKSEESKKEVLEIDYPLYWQPQEKDHQLFEVPEGSLEYNSIVDRFQIGLPKATVVKIKRNQNRRLWMWYLLKKKDVAKANGGNSNEKFVFHGSRGDAYDAILKEGLDHRVAQLSGAIGAGIYFAENSATSSGYVSGGKKKKMLMCRVTLGEVGPGKHGLRRPPPKGKKGTLYDSVGNGGGVYVIFDNFQSYPEYIITFTVDTGYGFY